MDSKLYPQGKTPHYSKYVSGVLKFFKRSDQSEIFSIDGVNGVNYEANKSYSKRVRVTTADLNSGATLIAAVPGYKIRLQDVTMIAYGGAATAATSVDIDATQSASGAILLAAAVGGLTENTILKPDTATHAVVLAAGASFAVNDVNTALTASVTGSALTTCTGVDFSLAYELVRA